MRFTPRTPVGDLYAAFIDAKPRDFDFSEGYPETWSYLEAARCEECDEAVVPVSGENVHWDIDEESDCGGYLYAEGPMMNYMYPIRWDRVGSGERAALALIDLPLCLVHLEKEEEFFLALTGGGMDLKWQIAEAYMVLGYLPPTHFSRLPDMAGKKLNSRNRWILSGMRASLLARRNWAKTDLRYLRNLRKDMANGS